MLTETLVEVRRVSKSFDRRAPVLKNVSFLVAARRDGRADRSIRFRQVHVDQGDRRAGADRQGRRRQATATAESDAIFLFGQPMQQNGRIIGIRQGIAGAHRRRLPAIQPDRAAAGPHQCLPRPARAPAVPARHARALQHRREAARHAGARPRRHGRARAQAGLGALRRPAAARRHRPHLRARRRVAHRGRADRLARSPFGAAGDGHPGRPEPAATA